MDSYHKYPYVESMRIAYEEPERYIRGLMRVHESAKQGLDAIIADGVGTRTYKNDDPTVLYDFILPEGKTLADYGLMRERRNIRAIAVLKAIS